MRKALKVSGIIVGGMLASFIALVITIMISDVKKDVSMTPEERIQDKIEDRLREAGRKGNDTTVTIEGTKATVVHNMDIDYDYEKLAELALIKTTLVFQVMEDIEEVESTEVIIQVLGYNDAGHEVKIDVSKIEVKRGLDINWQHYNYKTYHEIAESYYFDNKLEMALLMSNFK